MPLIISGPSVVSGGRTSGALVHAVDLFSTVLELAGVPLPTSVTLDSKSLKPILANQSPGVRTRLYTEQFTKATTTTGGRAIRDDRYKLIRFNTGTDEFYDLQASPSETVNLLVGGLKPVDQPYYNRLRFNLGGYSPAATPPPLSHAVGLCRILPHRVGKPRGKPNDVAMHRSRLLGAGKRCRSEPMQEESSLSPRHRRCRPSVSTASSRRLRELESRRAAHLDA